MQMSQTTVDDGAEQMGETNAETGKTSAEDDTEQMIDLADVQILIYYTIPLFCS